MNKLLRMAADFERLAEAGLKDYREDQDSTKVENLVEKALSEHKGDDVDVSYHKKHYGWFEWEAAAGRHEQRDMNDFEANEKIQDVRKFVKSLKRINLEDYK